MAAIPLWMRYKNFRSRSRTEFYGYVESLLQNELVQRLEEHRQHFKYTRLRHSLDVAYCSFWLAKLLRLDCRAVARAGLLHDLFFHSEGQHSASLLFSHPRIALENARSICTLSALEEDIILKHMFLLTPCIPRYRESFLVTFVDKYCASREYIVSLFVRTGSCTAAPVAAQLP